MKHEEHVTVITHYTCDVCKCTIYRAMPPEKIVLHPPKDERHIEDYTAIATSLTLVNIHYEKRPMYYGPGASEYGYGLPPYIETELDTPIDICAICYKLYLTKIRDHISEILSTSLRRSS